MGFLGKRAEDKRLELARMRFSSTDLFALLGGLDQGMLACPLQTTPYDEEAGYPLKAWRRRLIDRFEPLGIVDAAGNPCDELAWALEPLKTPGIVITDGNKLADPDDPDASARSFAVVRSGGRASAIVRAGGFRGGWLVMPFGTEDTWDEAFRDLLGFKKPFAPARRDCAALCSPDLLLRTNEAFMSGSPDLAAACASAVGVDGFKKPFAPARRDCAALCSPDLLLRTNEAFMSGSPDLAAACASAVGVDAAVLTDAAAAFAGPKPPHRAHLCTIDYTGCTFVNLKGCTVPLPEDKPYGIRQTTLVPSCGMAYSVITAPKPGDGPELMEDAAKQTERMFGRYDFVASTSLFGRLCEVGSYPDRFGALSLEESAR